MKILFATPPISRKELYGSLAGAGSSAPSLGLLHLAAVVRQAGYNTFVIDATAEGLSHKDFLIRVQRTCPDVVGFSLTTLTVAQAASLAAEIRGMLPATRIVIGGPHPSAVPVETCERYPVFDVAVVGEGEETIVELLEAFAYGKPLDNIRGIVYRRGGEVVANPRRPFLAQLDHLPLPAWDLLDGFPGRYSPPAFKLRKHPAASLVTSRGCPNLCIFCDRSVFGSSCHTCSADYVVKMILELYQRYGVREFCFEDDTFVTFRQRLMEICRRLIALKLDISWSCLGRVNQVTSELLLMMRQAGCWQISFGIESGSQKILDLIHKNTNLEQIRRAVTLCHEAGIVCKGFIIVGHPGETRETLRQTIDFTLEIPLDDISVMMLTPFPGSEIHARAAEFGTFNPDWSRMNMLNPVFVPHGLTEADLCRAQKELLRRFYLRPRIMTNYLLRGLRSPALIGSLWKGFCSFRRSL